MVGWVLGGCSCDEHPLRPGESGRVPVSPDAIKQQLDQEKAEAAQRARWGEAEDRSLPAGPQGVSTVGAWRRLCDLGTADLVSRSPSDRIALLSEVDDVAVTGEEDFRDGDAVTLAAMSDGQPMALRVSRRALLELAAGLATVPAVATAAVSHPRAVDPAVVDYLAELRGAAYSDADHTRLVPAHHVNVINTSGAGDTFLGTLAARLAHKVPLPDAVAEGVAAATTFVTIPGQQ